MIGLVVTSTASWVQQIIQKFRSPVLLLKDELAVRGVIIYPLERVRQFQREYLWKEIGAGRAGSMAEWEQLSIPAYQAYSDLEHIPPDIQKTISKVRTIPKTNVFVEWFNEDPFVFISDGKETYCIGYWNASDFQP